MKFDQVLVQEVVSSAWGWAIATVDEVLAVNSMANVLLRDGLGQYWRICPEELYAKMEARNDIEVEAVFGCDEYKKDWQLRGLIGKAENFFGPLDDGQCYALKKPGVLGGEYSVENMVIADIREYLDFTGSLAQVCKDIPDGTKVTFSWRHSG